MTPEEIADKVVPSFRVTQVSACNSINAKRWNVAHAAASMVLQQLDYASTIEPYCSALRMIREQIEDTFGPYANLESPEAVLLRGPEPIHDAEAICKALRTLGIHLAVMHGELDASEANVAHAENDQS